MLAYENEAKGSVVDCPNGQTDPSVRPKPRLQRDRSMVIYFVTQCLFWGKLACKKCARV